MNILEKIINFFVKPEEKVAEEDLIVNQSVDPTKIQEEQIKKDMQNLGKLEEKIANSEILTKEVSDEDEPEYIDGLTIKNPFIGE